MVVFLQPTINLFEEVSMIALQLLLLSYTTLPLATVIVFRFEQPTKGLLSLKTPMLVTEFGMLILTRLEQP